MKYYTYRHTTNFGPSVDDIITENDGMHTINESLISDFNNGTRIWYFVGYLHRNNGPAKISLNNPYIKLGEKSFDKDSPYEYWIFSEKIKNVLQFKNMIRTYLIDKMTRIKRYI